MIKYKLNTATTQELYGHLEEVSFCYAVPLANRVDLEKYAEKLVEKAVNLECWDRDRLVGHLGMYVIESQRTCFVTNVSVLPGFQGKGISKELLNNCLSFASKIKSISIALEVNKQNKKAIGLYKTFGFDTKEAQGEDLLMHKII